MRLLALLLALSVAGCTATQATPLPQLADPTPREWTRLRQRLAISRDARPESAYVEHVIVAMREPRTGKVFQARGAVAVQPGRALRMILLGPGGTTALDAWATDERFRFEVPGIALVRRGGTDGAEERGLPIGFLRWWLLHPLDGRMLAAWTRDDGALYLLRQGDRTVLLREGRANRAHRLHVVASMRDGEHIQRLEWLGRAPAAPHAGDMARYVDGATGLEVEVKVEAVEDHPPDATAFLDPDAQGVTL